MKQIKRKRYYSKMTSYDIAVLFFISDRDKNFIISDSC
jgi:hypothetical protein